MFYENMFWFLFHNLKDAITTATCQPPINQHSPGNEETAPMATYVTPRVESLSTNSYFKFDHELNFTEDDVYPCYMVMVGSSGGIFKVGN